LIKKELLRLPESNGLGKRKFLELFRRFKKIIHNFFHSKATSHNVWISETGKPQFRRAAKFYTAKTKAPRSGAFADFGRIPYLP
jgi:hypothetical protein